MDVLNRFLFQRECLRIGALVLCSAGKVLNGHFFIRIGRSVGQEAPGGGLGVGCLVHDWICVICKINKGWMIMKHLLIRNISKKQRSPSSHKAWGKFHPNPAIQEKLPQWNPAAFPFSSFLPLKIHPVTISSAWELILYQLCWMDEIRSSSKLSVGLICLWNQHCANRTHPNLCEQAEYVILWLNSFVSIKISHLASLSRVWSRTGCCLPFSSALHLQCDPQGLEGPSTFSRERNQLCVKL